MEINKYGQVRIVAESEVRRQEGEADIVYATTTGHPGVDNKGQDIYAVRSRYV